MAGSPRIVKTAFDSSLKLSELMIAHPGLSHTVFDFSYKILRSMVSNPDLSEKVFGLAISVFNDLVVSSPKYSKAGGISAEALIGFLSKTPILNITPTGVTFLDFERDGQGKVDPNKIRILFANDDAKKLFGLDAPVPYPLANVLTADSIEEVARRIEGAEVKGPRVQIPLRMKKAKGGEAPILVTPRILIFKNKIVIAATVERSISSAIQDIERRISTMTDMKEIVNYMLRQAMDLFDLQASAIKVDFDLASNSFKVLGRVGLPPEYELSRDVPLGGTASFQAQQTRETKKIPKLDEKTSSAAKAGMASALFVPLWVGAAEANIDPVGTWCLYIKDPKKFESLERKLDEIERFASTLLSIRIRESRLYAKEQSQKLCKELLTKVSQAINSPLEIEKVLDVLVSESYEMFKQIKGINKIRGCSLYIKQKDWDVLTPVVAKGREEVKMQVEVGDGSVIGTAALTKEPIFVRDAEKYFEGKRKGSFISIPILLGEELLGVLNISSDEKDMFNSEFDGPVIKTLAEMAATAINKAQIHDEMKVLLGKTQTLAEERKWGMMLDSTVPELLNLGMAEVMLLTKFEEAKTAKKPLTIFFIDIDHFKEVNKKIGHPAATQKIRDIGRVISTLKGENVWAGHFGGDEFLVIFYDVDKKSGERIANKLIKYVKNETGLGVTMKVKTFPDDALDPQTLLQKADTGDKDLMGRGLLPA